MPDFSQDKIREQLRYDRRVQGAQVENLQLGSSLMPKGLAAPYRAYEDAIAKYISRGQKVLELGAGQGEHSLSVLQQDVHLTALDISEKSLAALCSAVPEDYKSKVTPLKGDMEFPDVPKESFDAVVSAGAMSYADRNNLITMLSQVLRSGGWFIAVDSWNHNPIYRFNRWRHFRRGDRTEMTLLNMPNTKTLDLLQKNFNIETRYFGCLTFICPLLRPFLSAQKIETLLRISDMILPGRILAFKVLIIAKKK